MVVDNTTTNPVEDVEGVYDALRFRSIRSGGHGAGLVEQRKAHAVLTFRGPGEGSKQNAVILQRQRLLTRIKSLITLITSSRVDHSSPTTARRSVFEPCAIF